MRRGDAPAPAAWSIGIPNARATVPRNGVEARWSADGSRIVVSRLVDPRAWPLLDAARPDVGALLVVGGMIALVWGVVRILCRPRAPGRDYCRCCNHVARAGPGEWPLPARCPECGRSLAGRGAVAGRSLRSRLTRLAVPACAAMGCGAALFVASIRFEGSGVFDSAWPIPAASAIQAWPLWRQSTLEGPERAVRRLDVIHLQEDGLRLERTVTAQTREGWITSTDGSMIAWLEGDDPDQARAAWVDTARGVRGFAEVGGDADLPARICGWTSDGRELLVLRPRRQDSGFVDTAFGQARGCELLAIDTESCAIRVVESFGARSLIDASSPIDQLVTIAACRTGARPCTATLAGEWKNGPGSGIVITTIHELSVVDAGGTRRMLIDVEDIDVPEFRRAWITEDDKLGIEFVESWGYPDEVQYPSRVFLIDLADGSVSERRPSETRMTDGDLYPRVHSPDGSKCARLIVDRSRSGAVTGIRVLVMPGVARPGAGRR